MQKRKVVPVLNSLPTNAEVKKTWIYISTPAYVFMTQCLMSDQLHVPAVLPPGEEPQVPIGSEVGRASEPVSTTWRT
jgi:hypothetical protein